MCSLCVLKYTKGAFLTASSLLGNLFKDIYIYIYIFFFFFSFFFWGGGGWGGGGVGGPEKNHDYISRDPHTENHKIHHPTLRLCLCLFECKPDASS